MNEDIRYSSHKKIPPLNVEALDWAQDIAAFHYISEYGSQEDKKKLHEMALSFQKIDEILKKVAQRNENKRNSQ